MVLGIDGECGGGGGVVFYVEMEGIAQRSVFRAPRRRYLWREGALEFGPNSPLKWYQM